MLYNINTETFKITKEKPNGYDFQLFGIDNRLEQILANLLDNALSFSPSKGQVSIYIQGKKDTVSLSVKDQGPGFSETNTDKIFKRFYSNRPEKFGEHSGLGLNIVKNLVDLQRRVLETEADIGLAFDGDADRIGVVDNEGYIIWADQLMALFLPEIINPNDQVIFDVKCSKVLEDMILKHNGKPEMWKTGHSLIKQRMAELKCKFGGEMSGHIFFNDDWYGFDDAIFSAVILTKIITDLDVSISELVNKIPSTHSTPELNLNVKDEEKFNMVEKFKSAHKRMIFLCILNFLKKIHGLLSY